MLYLPDPPAERVINLFIVTLIIEVELGLYFVYNARALSGGITSNAVIDIQHLLKDTNRR